VQQRLYFPGLGLGILATKAERVTEAMLITCSKTLAAHSPLATTGKGGLLPPVEEIEMISRAIALDVALVAQAEGVAANSARKS
jgi:malate dehydrogenase (oxaloacetate-decarboxylating)